MNASLKAACAIPLGFLIAGGVAADQTGEIRGLVTHVAGEALPGVVVTARSPSLQGQRSTTTDARGAFRLPLLPVGSYSLTFEIRGFETRMLTGNDVRLGATTSLSVSLKLSARAVQVTVTAENPLVDTTTADTSYRLRGGELARVPAQGRTLAEVVGYTPGVTGVRVNTVTGSDTGLPSFRGEGDAGNNWLVDGLSTKGVNINDSGIRVNYDAWDEVQVISDGFQSELGQAMGGFVNVATKSGGNTFHGEVGALVRDQSLRSSRQEQLSAASLPETSIGQYYGNVGGPILKDKLWFFVSDNYLSTTDLTTEQSVGWLEIPAGQRSTRSNNVFAKVTFTPVDNHTVFASGMLDKSPEQTGGIGVPETYTAASYENSLFRVNYTGIFGPSVLVTAAGGQNRRDNSSVVASGDYGSPSYFWQDISQRTNNATNRLTESERRTDLSLGGSYSREFGRWGSHEIKAGVSYYSNSYQDAYAWTGKNADPWPGNGFDDGVGITWTAPGVPLSLAEWQPGRAKDSTRGFGFYLQDTVTFGRFTLMLGLRSDTQQVYDDVGTKLWSWGVGDFLQPRVSLAVDLTGDGRTIFKAGYGQFSMPIATAALSFYNRDWNFSYRQYAWTGPANPTDAQLNDPGNWEFQFEQSNTGSPSQIDPALKPDRVQRMLVAFERQLSTMWAVKLRGIYSRCSGLIEDVGLYAPETPSGYGFMLTNFDLKRRDYRAVEIELNGRVGSKLFLDASYTWSRARGTVPGNSFESGFWGVTNGSGYNVGGFGDHPYVPAGDPNKDMWDFLLGGMGGLGVGDEGWYGDLPYSVDHVVKILATWVAPYGIRISPGFEWLSGYHWEKKGWSNGYGVYVTFPEGRGTRTTPAHAYVDLAVEKDFDVGKGITLGVGVSVYNLFNSQTPVSYVKEDTDLFGQVWARQLPRWVQLKAAVRF